MRIKILTTVLLLASPLGAQEIMTVTVPESVEDMEFAVESAIIDMGLTIDFISNTGDMLARTKADVGSDIDLYADATLFNFCSARVSRQVLEVDPTNVAYCPYTIFIYSLPDNPDVSIIGHQVYPGESMAPANALLDAIIESATQ